MSDRALPDPTTPARSKRKWLIGLWLASVTVATTGWWAGLTVTAVWLVQRALS